LGCFSHQLESDFSQLTLIVSRGFAGENVVVNLFLMNINSEVERVFMIVVINCEREDVLTHLSEDD
jgi:hypothetical protein